jgi:hypothetical protein
MSPTGERLVLVVGDTLLAARLCAWMDGEPGFCTAHLAAPSDSKLQATLEQGGVEAVVIAVHEDVSALRHALVVAHTAPDVRTIVTVFDQTMKERLGQLWPHLEIVSPAEIVAPSLAGPCVLPGALAAWTDGGRPYALSDPVRGPEELARPPAVWSDGVAGLRARLRQVALGVHLGQTTGTRMLVAGTGGAGLVLVADWAWLVRLGLPPREAFFDAVRVVSTVGPAVAHGSDAYMVFAGMAMLATIAFSAILTAGLIERFLEPRVLSLFGSRRAPRSGHVVVIGMGPVRRAQTSRGRCRRPRTGLGRSGAPCRPGAEDPGRLRTRDGSTDARAARVRESSGHRNGRFGRPRQHRGRRQRQRSRPSPACRDPRRRARGHRTSSVLREVGAPAGRRRPGERLREGASAGTRRRRRRHRWGDHVPDRWRAVCRDGAPRPQTSLWARGTGGGHAEALKLVRAHLRPSTLSPAAQTYRHRRGRTTW